MAGITIEPIGIIRSPFKTLEQMPIQPSGALGITGRVEIDACYEAGLQDIEGFSHLFLIYWFHYSKGFDLRVKPFLDDALHGVFATRAPRRPNAVGLSVVALRERRGRVLMVENIDVLDGTPLIDLKPYVPSFDTPDVTRVGWLEGKQGAELRTMADSRFAAASGPQEG